MIDVFLIFGQLYPFAEVILLTIMKFHREGDGSGEINASQEDFTPVKVDNETIEITAKEIGGEPVDKLYWFKVTGESNVRRIQLTNALFRVKDTSWNYATFH